MWYSMMLLNGTSGAGFQRTSTRAAVGSPLVTMDASAYARAWTPMIPAPLFDDVVRVTKAPRATAATTPITVCTGLFCLR